MSVGEGVKKHDAQDWVLKLSAVGEWDDAEVGPVRRLAGIVKRHSLYLCLSHFESRDWPEVCIHVDGMLECLTLLVHPGRDDLSHLSNTRQTQRPPEAYNNPHIAHAPNTHKMAQPYMSVWQNTSKISLDSNRTDPVTVTDHYRDISDSGQNVTHRVSGNSKI